MKFFQPEYWFLLGVIPLLALFFLWSWQKRKHDRDIFLRGMSLERLKPSLSSGKVAAKAAFLLIAYPRSDRSIWVALRYLFIGNTVMLFYLIGVALVYQAHHSFAFAGLRGSPQRRSP